MKNILLLTMILTTAVAYAQDLKKSKSISCSSQAHGNFILRDLDRSNPKFISSTTSDLKIISKSNDSISYRLINGVNYKLTLTSKVISKERVGSSTYLEYDSEIEDDMGGIFSASCLVEIAN